MESKYLQLIVDTFEELQPISESTIEEKRNTFQEMILKRFSEVEQTDLITKTDFTNNCEIAVQKLRKHITDYISQIRNTRLNRHILAINFGLRDKDLINYGNLNLNRKKEIKSKKDSVHKHYGKDYLVDINSIAIHAKNKMCLFDIEFIESALQSITHFAPKEVNPLNSILPLVKKTTPEKHSEIFCNNGFILFEHILSEYVKPKNKTGRYEDLSYHYRRLFGEKFIHQKPEPFRNWFMKEFNEEFSKIKTIQQTENTQRKKDYSTALEWLRLQNK